ncbi:MAG: lipopolysaccharide biosynthesis protein [Moheibacter sp.]
MSITKNIKSGGFWKLVETLGMILCQFGYISVMARLLSKSDFGLMALANAIIGLGSILTEGGMGAALIQYQNITIRHKNAALIGNFITGFLFFGLTYFLSDSISHFFNQPELSNIIKIIAINFILLSISSISLNLLYKSLNFKSSSILTLFATIVGYTVGVILAWNGFGVWSLVYATLVMSVLKAILYFYFAPIKFRPGWYIQEWKELFSFGSGMILLRFSNYLSSGGINLALGKVFAPTLLGVFERSFQIKTLPSKYLGGILDKVMFPIMSQIQDEEERLFKVFYFGLGFSNSILMPISLYLIYFSKEIVLILLGEDWFDAVLPLQIMFVILPFSISSQMADSVIRAKGYIYKNVVRKYIYVTILLSSTILLGYFYGIVGAAIGVTVSHLLNYLLMIILVKKIFDKSVREIFYNPLKEASLLSIYLSCFLGINYIFTNLLYISSIINLIVTSFILGLIAIIVILKKPLILGSYIFNVLKIYQK